MDLKRISEMVSAVCASRTVTELSLRQGGNRVVIRRTLAVPVGGTLAPAPEAVSGVPAAELRSVRSHLVGIFHHRASDSHAAIGVGSAVREGQILGAVESMRMLYEVVSGFTGAVTEVLVEDGQPVEYGQELFRIHVAPGSVSEP